MIFSLSQVENIVGLNSRKIQEYEKKGLCAKPEQAKEKSYQRMYTEQHINELFRLRFYHELGIKFPK